MSRARGPQSPKQIQALVTSRTETEPSRGVWCGDELGSCPPRAVPEGEQRRDSGSGAKGQVPLVFVLNGTPFRGFLEGRVDADGYLLVLQCSNLELKATPT